MNAIVELVILPLVCSALVLLRQWQYRNPSSTTVVSAGSLTVAVPSSTFVRSGGAVINTRPVTLTPRHSTPGTSRQPRWYVGAH